MQQYKEDVNLGSRLTTVGLLKLLLNVQTHVKDGGEIHTLLLKREEDRDVIATVAYLRDQDPAEEIGQDVCGYHDEHPQSEEAGSEEVS